ncbi:hypothetical protein KY329_00685 [Candidatus Woesearchaeota archaeon]|nr:hypothetical protein [Candidatus Woesearchaeota archaeon]
MAEKTEVDMDVFSRRISPYFTWLESRIESGWKQSDSCKKDVLKETRTMATNLRARFILGVNKEDLKQELANTMELFDLAIDAFPDYASEVESKVEHFAKGIRTELGEDLLPNGFANGVAKVQKARIVKKVKKEKIKVEKVQKVKKKTVKKKIKKVEPVEPEITPVEEKKEVAPEEPPKIETKPKKPNPVIKWLRNAIFGDDL